MPDRPELNEDRLRAIIDQAVAEARGTVQIDGKLWTCVPSHIWAQIVFEVNPPKEISRGV